MDSTNENEVLRRSRRLRNNTPELPGLVGPERTPPKTKAVENNIRKKSPDSSSDEDSIDEDASENISLEGGLKIPNGNGTDVLFSSLKLENQTARQVSNLFKSSHRSSMKLKNNNPTELFTQNRLSRSSVITQRKMTIDNSAGSQEPECSRQSIPLSNQGIPSPQVQPRLNNLLFSRNWPIICIAALFLLFYFSYSPQDEIKCDGFYLQQKFPKQTSKLWNYVNSSRSTSKPFVLLLVHDGHEDVTSCLAKQIAKEVACHRTKMVVEPKVIDGREDIKLEHLISERQELDKRKSLVVLHVEDMNPDIAGFFHFILDVEEPWVSSGVYVLTLNVPNIGVDTKNAYASVRKFLMKKWSGVVKEDNMDPLITRFGNQEYVVKEDSNPCH